MNVVGAHASWRSWAGGPSPLKSACIIERSWGGGRSFLRFVKRQSDTLKYRTETGKTRTTAPRISVGA
jgi:hypothetical protein